MRPCSAGASRNGSVTSMVSDASRASSAADFRMSRRAVNACVTLSLARLMAAPCVLRSSGDILPRVEAAQRSSPSCRARRRARLRGRLRRRQRRCRRNGLFECCEVGHDDGPCWEDATVRPPRSSSSAKADDPVTQGSKCSSVVTGCPQSLRAAMTPEVAGRRSDCRDLRRQRGLGLFGDCLERRRLVMARSDSTLRSTVMPDFDRPLMKTL